MITKEQLFNLFPPGLRDPQNADYSAIANMVIEAHRREKGAVGNVIPLKISWGTDSDSWFMYILNVETLALSFERYTSPQDIPQGKVLSPEKAKAKLIEELYVIFDGLITAQIKKEEEARARNLYYKHAVEIISQVAGHTPDQILGRLVTNQCENSRT